MGIDGINLNLGVVAGKPERKAKKNNEKILERFAQPSDVFSSNPSEAHSQALLSNSPKQVEIGKAASILDKVDSLKNRKAELKKLWQQDSLVKQNDINSARINISSDGVAVASGNNRIFALDADTGRVLWEKDSGNTKMIKPSVSDDGIAYFTIDVREIWPPSAPGKTRLMALNSKTGESVWEKNFPVMVNSAPLCDRQGNLFLATLTRAKHKPSASLIKLDGKTGKQIWKCNIRDSVWDTPVQGKDGKIFAASDKNTITAVSQDGSILWQKGFNVPDSVASSSPLIVGKDGTLFVHFSEKELFAINPDSGEKKWSIQCKTDSSSYGNSLVKAGNQNNILILGNKNTLYSFDAENGKEQWSVKCGSGLKNFITMPNGLVAVGNIDSPKGKVSLYDGSNGREVGKVDVEGRLQYDPAVSKDDILYLSQAQCVVSAVRVEYKGLSAKIQEEAASCTEIDQDKGSIEVTESHVVIGGIKLPVQKRS